VLSSDTFNVFVLPTASFTVTDEKPANSLEELAITFGNPEPFAR